MKIGGTVKHHHANMRHWVLFYVILTVCIVSTFLARSSSLAFFDAIPLQLYLLLHNGLEYAATLFGTSIFLISVYTYRLSQNAKLLTAGYTFLAIAIFDLMHIMSYPEMPAIFGVAVQSTRTYSFYMLSRICLVVGMILVVSVEEQRKKQASAVFWTVAVCVICCTVGSIVIWENGWIPQILNQEGSLTAAGIVVKWFILLLFAGVLIKIFMNYRHTKDHLNLTFAIGIMFQMFSELSMLQFETLGYTENIVGHLLKVFGFIALFDVFFVNGISRPYEMLKETKNQLNHYVDDLDKQVEKRTKELTHINQKLMTDMGIARDIQRSFLPTSFPQDEMVRFSVEYQPAENLSGDFYNIFNIDASRYGLFIGDVSGHGVSASMLTIFAFQSIQSLVEDSQGSAVILPSFVLKHVYELFNAANFSDEHYMVMLYGVYNLETGIFSYASGGLNTIPMRIRPDGSVMELDNEGYAICKLGNYLKPKFSNRQILLFPGDKLVFYTDGVTEAKNLNNEEYGQGRLKALLKSGYRLSADDLSIAIGTDVRVFTGKDLPKDDITILVMEILPPF